MAKSEHEQLREAPSGVVAGNIALNAHGRVYDVLDPLIEDKTIPEAAREVLTEAREIFADKASRRLDRVLQ